MMSIDDEAVKTAPKSLNQVQPNMKLLLIGLFVGGAAFLGNRLGYMPIDSLWDAFFISVAMTLILYGLAPVLDLYPNQIVKLIQVGGPATLGLSLFIYVFTTRDVKTPYSVLIDAKSGSDIASLADGTKISLLDVDSLNDNEVSATLRNLNGLLKSHALEKTLPKAVEMVADSANLPEARKAWLIDIAVKLQKGELDDQSTDQEWQKWFKDWETRNKTAANRAKGIPWAVTILEKDKTEALILTPRSILTRGSTSYSVSAIANPKKTEASELSEALVLRIRLP